MFRNVDTETTKCCNTQLYIILAYVKITFTSLFCDKFQSVAMLLSNINKRTWNR